MGWGVWDQALGNYAVFLQLVRGQLDDAELLYRRALDADGANDCVLQNYVRLQQDMVPDGRYAAYGPSRIAMWRAQVYYSH